MQKGAPAGHSRNDVAASGCIILGRMPSSEDSNFDASASLIGYLYQVRMALVLLLQRTDDDPSIALSLEKFDDVTFHSGEKILEQLQTKHVTQKNLTDASVDLWKTLRIWANRFRRRLLDP